MNPEIAAALMAMYERQLRLGSPLIEAWRGFGSAAGAGATPPEAAPAEHERRAETTGVLDLLRVHGLILEEVFRIHSLLLQALLPRRSAVDSDPGRQRAARARETTAGDGPDFSSVLRTLEGLVMLHPVAAQAAFSAVIAEGRRFSQSMEGKRWTAALLASPVLAKLRRIWESTSLSMLEEKPTTVLPTMFIEAIFGAARSANLEALLDPRRSI